MIYYQDHHIKVYNSDCRDMSELQDESVQCCVTSPPYWGLRKYAGLPDSIFGDNQCEHQWQIEKLGEGYKGSKRWQHLGGRVDEDQHWDKSIGQTNTCQLCGAWKGQYGLEPTPELYIQHTVEILREIRRVLRPDGVVWWNIGDSYAGTKQGNTESIKNPNVVDGGFVKSTNGSIYNLKPKDLCLIPFRVAIAAQSDGWWIRSDIIWFKPNPMPESVTDRPTNSHEYILMLTKSKNYYWDASAVREPQSPLTLAVHRGGKRHNSQSIDKKRLNAGETSRTSGYNTYELPNGRNLRDVWEIATQPYPDAHFATFPQKIPETCIKAATPEEGCCSKCGSPYERITENKPMEIRRTDWGDKAGNRTASSGTMISPPETKTIGWNPTCKCNADKVPSIVLDPFAGSGTTLWVAKKLGRKSIGYELSTDYCKLIVERNRQQVF